MALKRPTKSWTTEPEGSAVRLDSLEAFALAREIASRADTRIPGMPGPSRHHA